MGLARNFLQTAAAPHTPWSGSGAGALLDEAALGLHLGQHSGQLTLLPLPALPLGHRNGNAWHVLARAQFGASTDAIEDDLLRSSILLRVMEPSRVKMY